MKAMEHTAHTTPRYTDVMFGYCGVLIDWRPRRTIEGLYPAGVVDMFFDPADPHGVAYYDDLADLGWSEERIIADYEREHGPAVAWIMRLYFEFQRLGTTSPTWAGARSASSPTTSVNTGRPWRGSCACISSSNGSGSTT